MFNRFSRANHANENYDGNITGKRFAQSISNILYGFCDQNPSLLYINLNSFFSTIFDQFVALRLDKEISNTANDIARNSLYCADIIKDYDIDDENKLLRLMKIKISEEERSTEHLKHIKWDMRIIKKLCVEFSEKCEEVFMLIYKYKNVEDLENYIYNEL